jgi:hypothetical protein
MAKKMNEFSYSTSSAGVAGRYFGQSISECHALAFPVAASPTDYPKLQGHGHPLDRQILHATFMPTVAVR